MSINPRKLAIVLFAAAIVSPAFLLLKNSLPDDTRDVVDSAIEGVIGGILRGPIWTSLRLF